MSDFAELHDDLRAVARELLSRPIDDAAGWARIADAGWLGLEVPEALGGADATFAEAAVVAEEIGRAAASSPYLGTAILGVAALRSVVESPQRDDLLRNVAAGTTRVAVATAPTGDALGADAPFRVERTGGSIVLHGRAEFVVDATEADHLLLLAVDADRGPLLVHVEPGPVEVVAQPVVDATRRFGAVVAKGVAVEESTIWSFEDDPSTSAQRLVDRAAVAVACDSFGLAGAMLDATVDYVGARRQFGRPIGSFQAVKHACADMAVSLTVGRELLTAAVEAVATDRPTEEASAGAAVARAKSFVCAAAVDVVGAAMQLHGGIGYTWESGVHVYLKRAVLNRSLVGSPAAHRRRLAETIRAEMAR